ncbi:hypothetical protein ILYODFUR_039067 [Ilyodon furcidens]|uniref:Uncharacterized protein n=1 Tax=Ilyodon furcidens TaxID=33524 RepID=A0ABV0VBI4_9TELE
MSRTTRTFASSGFPISLMKTLQFVVHVDWIFFCLLRNRAFLAMSAFFLVRGSLMNTSDPFSNLPCFSRADLCFRLLNLMIAGVVRNSVPLKYSVPPVSGARTAHCSQRVISISNKKV